MRVALYERVSSEEQVLHGYSLEAQDSALRKFVEEHGYIIVDTYKDEGISAHKPYTARPELLRLLDDADKIDLILFVKLDRWFRNVKEYYKVQEILDKNNVCWQAITEDYETITANGRFTVTIMLAIAQQEAEKTGERIKFVIENKLQNNQPITGNYGFGFKTTVKNDVKTVIHDENEPIVYEMFDYFLKVQNVSMLNDYMKEKYGIIAANQTWSRRLRNISYAGTAHGIANFLPPYITIEKHYEILDVLESRRSRRTNNRTYLFSGILKCPECGGAMAGCTCIQNGKEYRYYRCSKCWNKGGCSNKKSTYESVIEKFLLENLEEQAKLQLAEKPREMKSTKSLEERLKRLNDIYLMGNMEKSEYDAKTKEIKEKIVKIQMENKKHGECSGAKLSMNFKKVYETLSKDGKKVFWRNTLDKIFVSENISFTFRG